LNTRLGDSRDILILTDTAVCIDYASKHRSGCTDFQMREKEREKERERKKDVAEKLSCQGNSTLLYKEVVWGVFSWGFRN